MRFFPKNSEEKSKMINETVKYLLAILLVFIMAGFILILEKLLGKQNFDSITSLLIIIIASITFLIIIIKAGFTVIKSLFFVAAEISLLIFLSQSYCTIDNRTTLSDDALKNILIIGFLYIIISFLRSLWKELREEYKSIRKDKSWEKIVFIIIFIVFILFFMWQICLVVEPIIQSLCILNPI